MENNTVVNNRIDEIAYNTRVTMNADLFLIAILVVIVVCYILWKSIDNFLSY